MTDCHKILESRQAIYEYYFANSTLVTLEYYEATGDTKNGEMKCKVNVEHAKTVLVFACPGVECAGGDFDLSDALAGAVADRRKTLTGELRCQGTRKRTTKEGVPCQTLLRYKLNLDYDRGEAEKGRTSRESPPPAQEENGPRADLAKGPSTPAL